METQFKPIPIAFELAVNGPLLYPPGTLRGSENPDKVAAHAPTDFYETMDQVRAGFLRGATSFHVHPIALYTAEHLKDPRLYAANTLGIRKRAPDALVNNDASLNGVDNRYYATPKDYLRVRLAGLDNDAPPDVFTLFATNEALLVNETSKEPLKKMVESFIKAAGSLLQRDNIVALSEITQEPYGMRSVHRGLEILDAKGIKLPGLAFSFLVNGTNSFPAYFKRGLAGKSSLTYTDSSGQEVPESPKERFMRIVGEALKVKDDSNLAGPLTFGTIVRASEDPVDGKRYLQHDVWDWVAEAAIKYEEGFRKYGIILKGGLEEWSSYQGYQVTNPETVSIMRAYMSGLKHEGVPLFEPVTDAKIVRNWAFPKKQELTIEQSPAIYPASDATRAAFALAGRAIFSRPQAPTTSSEPTDDSVRIIGRRPNGRGDRVSKITDAPAGTGSV